MNSLLTASALSKSFDALEILHNLSLEILPGTTTAITGPSGSGKSTLLHILGTLDTPTSGSVEIAGRNPFELPEAELAKFRNERIGFVFQDAYLLPQFSALENVLLPVRAFGKVDDAVRDRAIGLLETVGLGERTNHLPGQLSGGERQRAAIARSLVMAPGLLLCDEPTGSLDAATAERVTDALLVAAGDGDRALVVITHSERLAERMERHLTLRDGQCFAA